MIKAALSHNKKLAMVRTHGHNFFRLVNAEVTDNLKSHHHFPPSNFTPNLCEISLHIQRESFPRFNASGYARDEYPRRMEN